MIPRGTLLSLLLILAAPGRAEADELESFCVDRPGLGTPDCTIDAGHAVVELGIADWTHTGEESVNSDTFVLGEMLVRYGIASKLEVQVGWHGLSIDRNEESDDTSRQTTVGDIRLALRRRFGDPDGLSAAVMPFVTVPVSDAGTNGGDWTAGLIVPVEYALPHGLELDFTGEIDAAADAQGSGHHLAYSGTIGVGVPLGSQVLAAIELQASRDEDRFDKSGEFLGGFSLAWSPPGAWQFDAGTVIGLGHHDADFEFYAGIARRF
jgi:hypothetical protein